MRLLAPFVVAIGLCAAPDAHAQFRNMGVQFSVGWLSLGTSLDWLNQQIPDYSAPWNVHDHVTLGAGYFIFVGYHLRLDSQVVLGGGTDIYGANITPVFDLQVSQGMRYMFMNEKHRPFVSAHIQYLNLFVPSGRANVNDGDPLRPLPGNDFILGQPFWVGLRAGGGYEWIFAEEQGLEVELGLVGLFGFYAGDLIRPSAVGRVAWNIYF